LLIPKGDLCASKPSAEHQTAKKSGNMVFVNASNQSMVEKPCNEEEKKAERA